MANLTIRDLDDALKLKLRLRAARANRSMEEEVRQILRSALEVEAGPEAGAPGTAFYASIRARFAALGDVVLPIEPREPVRTPPALHELHEPEPTYDVGPRTGGSRP